MCALIYFKTGLILNAANTEMLLNKLLLESTDFYETSGNF